MKIQKKDLPKNSLLDPEKIKYDYIDCYQGIVKDSKDNITVTDVGKSFFLSSPKWVDQLFAARNTIVSIFGLKTAGSPDEREALLKSFKCEKGEQLGLFKVFDKNENEVILGEDDKHLNFRISLYLEKEGNQPDTKNLKISTTVQFNNWFGLLYFLPVRAFHQLIVPTMLKAIIKNLEKETSGKPEAQ